MGVSGSLWGSTSWLCSRGWKSPERSMRMLTACGSAAPCAPAVGPAAPPEKQRAQGCASLHMLLSPHCWRCCRARRSSIGTTIMHITGLETGQTNMPWCTLVSEGCLDF